MHTVETFNVAPTRSGADLPAAPSMPGALTSRAASQTLVTHTVFAIINELRRFRVFHRCTGCFVCSTCSLLYEHKASTNNLRYL